MPALQFFKVCPAIPHGTRTGADERGKPLQTLWHRRGVASYFLRFVVGDENSPREGGRELRIPICLARQPCPTSPAD